MPPTPTLVVQWKDDARLTDFNRCAYNGDTLAGIPAYVVLFLRCGSDVTAASHILTEIRENANHANQVDSSANLPPETPQPNEPCAPTVQPGERLILFRHGTFAPTRMHNTTSPDTKWTIRAAYSWGSMMGGGGSAEASIVVSLNDMLMTPDAANPPYFFWNPDNPPAESQRKVKFTLTDEQKNTVQVQVKVYRLDRGGEELPLRTYTTTIACPTATPFEWIWDGTDDAGGVQPPGIYPYDVQVRDVSGMPYLDTDEKTSGFLSIGNILLLIRRLRRFSRIFIFMLLIRVIRVICG